MEMLTGPAGIALLSAGKVIPGGAGAGVGVGVGDGVGVGPGPAIASGVVVVDSPPQPAIATQTAVNIENGNIRGRPGMIEFNSTSLVWKAEDHFKWLTST